MYILAIETTGEIGSVALTDGDEIIVSRSTGAARSHLKELIPMISASLEDAHIKAKDLDAIAASVGPGSFTGIRIGVATARGLGQSLDIPCIAVGTLDLFRQSAYSNLEENQSPHKVVAIINARRGQVYGAIFDEEGEDILIPGPYMLQDVKEKASGLDNLVWYGDGVDAYGEELQDVEKAPLIYRYQTADMLAKIAPSILMRGQKTGEKFSYKDMMPKYMRLAEAEQKLKDGTLERLRRKKLARLMKQ